MERHPESNQDRTGLALVGCALVFYLMTLSRNWSGDAIQFALFVRSGVLGNIVQPNHMLYGLLGAVVSRLAQLIGWHNGPLLPLQVVSALGGALSVGLVYAVGRKQDTGRAVALWVAFGYGVSRAVWANSTDAEVVTTGLATSLLVLWALVSSSDEALARLRAAVTLGIAAGLAILSYQTSVFLVPVVLAARLATKSHKRGWLPWIVVFLAVVSAVVVPITALVGLKVYHVASWTGLVNWILQQTQWGIWGQPTLGSLARGGYGLLKALAGFPGLEPFARTAFFLAQANLAQRAFFAAYYALLLSGVCLPLILTIRYRAWRMMRPRDRAALGAWVLGYGAFALYWAPADAQFWAPLLVPWWLVAGLACEAQRGEETRREQPVAPSDGLHQAGEAPSNGHASSARTRGAICLWLRVMVLALVAANATSFGLPNRQISANGLYQVASLVAERTHPQDLIITTGADRMVLYIPYFGERRALSIYHLLRRPGTDREAAWAELEGLIERTRSAGHDVYTVGIEPGQEVWWDVMEGIGASRAEIGSRLSQRFQWTPSWSVAGEELLKLAH